MPSDFHSGNGWLHEAECGMFKSSAARISPLICKNPKDCESLSDKNLTMRQPGRERNVGFLKLRKDVYPKLASWISTLVVFGITLQRARSYAQSQTPKVGSEDRLDLEIPSAGSAGKVEKGTKQSDIVESNMLSSDDERVGSKEPLEDARMKKYNYVKTRAEACKAFEGKIVTYTDQTSLVTSCKQRLIEDPELLNELVHSQNKQVIEVPASVYRLMPFGEPFNRTDSFSTRKTSNKKITADECESLNDHYITVSGMNYYYVESCKKRAFSDFSELQAHNRGKSTIVSITPELFYRIPNGAGMKPQANDEAKILYKIDGGVAWSRLDRKEGENVPSDSPESLNKIHQKSKERVNKAQLCTKFNRKIVSFYSQIYFIDDCKKRNIKELSIPLQQKIAEHGGITDLTPEQIAAIPNGKEISESDVMKSVR